jgi:hypothetical protein
MPNYLTRQAAEKSPYFLQKTKKHMIEYSKSILTATVKKIYHSHYSLLVLMIAPSVVWVFFDNSVWPWDQAWYGQMSVELYYKMAHFFPDWYPAMIKAFASKAPGIAWLGQFFVPFGFYIGVERALLLSVIIAQFIALAVIFKIIFSLTSSREISLMGSLAMASAPLFIGMGHQYFVESLQLLAVVFFVYIAAKGKDWSKYDQIATLLAALAFAMIVKISTPLYVFLPALVILRNIWTSFGLEAKEDFFSRKLLKFFAYAGSIGFLAMTVNWYAVNGGHILKFMKETSSGSVAMLYGAKMPFFSKLAYWMGAVEKGYFIPSVFVALSIIIVLAVGALYLKKVNFSNRKLNFFALISVGSFAAVIAFFSLQVNEETRYLLPLLVYPVIMMSWILFYLKDKQITYLFLVLFLFQFFIINGYSLNLIKINKPSFNVWVIPVNNDVAEKAQTQLAVAKTCIPESSEKINMVGVEYPWFNANSLAFYAAKSELFTGVHCYYTSLGYAETDAEKAWLRMTEIIKPPYFIGVSREALKQKEDAFNVVSLPVLERVEKSSLFQKEGFSQASPVQIYKSSFPAE